MLSAGVTLSLSAIIWPHCFARLWPGTPVQRMRLVSVVVFLFTATLFAYSLYELSRGTFRWRGSARAYGLSDLFR